MPTADSNLVTAALIVLREATHRSARQRTGDSAVRLALRVLLHFTSRRNLLEAYWSRATADPHHPWDSTHNIYAAIKEALVQAGWDVADEDVPCQGHAMCNRYRMTANQADLAARYGVDAPYDADLTIPPPELFPKRPAWTVTRDSWGNRALRSMAWGFPRTMRGARGQPVETRVTNVRNLESQFWRSALDLPGRRCLVPVTTFSEYGPGPKGSKPLYWFDVPSRPVFSFAGIWRPAEGGPVFAFLTTDPNSVVAPIHPKAMPVILHDEDEERWLSEPFDAVASLAAPYPAQLMTVTQAKTAPA